MNLERAKHVSGRQLRRGRAYAYSFFLSLLVAVSIVTMSPWGWYPFLMRLTQFLFFAYAGWILGQMEESYQDWMKEKGNELKDRGL